MEDESSKIFGTAKILASQLKTIHSQDECEIIIRILLEEVLQLPYSRIKLLQDPSFSPVQLDLWRRAQDRLLMGEPLQYVLGKAWFDGLTLSVSPATLIPRPETEELVHWAYSIYNKESSPFIVDACTGSGCIALALKKRIPDSTLVGFDLSPEAVEMARENSKRLHLPASFQVFDALSSHPSQFSNVSLLISNPPYILDSEAADMANHVLQHEPTLALFAPKNDALAFYKAIAQSGRSWLQPGGHLLFEINPLFHQELESLLCLLGYTHVELRKDMQGKWRMAYGRNP